MQSEWEEMEMDRLGHGDVKSTVYIYVKNRGRGALRYFYFLLSLS